MIGLGGGLGAILRYLVSGWVQNISNNSLFPYGTLAVNILGCLVIGFLSGLVDRQGFFSPETRSFVFIGLLGGFTTFSTFGNESINLLRSNENALAAVYLVGHLTAGLTAVWVGRVLVRWIWR